MEFISVLIRSPLMNRVYRKPRKLTSSKNATKIRRSSKISGTLKYNPNCGGPSLPKSCAAHCARSSTYCPEEMKTSMLVGNATASKNDLKSGSRIELRTDSLPSLPITHSATPRTIASSVIGDNLENQSL